MTTVAVETTLNPDELLTPESTAKILDITVGCLAIWRHTKRHNLPFVKIGRLVKYRRRDVMEWIESRTTVPVTA